MGTVKLRGNVCYLLGRLSVLPDRYNDIDFLNVPSLPQAVQVVPMMALQCSTPDAPCSKLRSIALFAQFETSSIFRVPCSACRPAVWVSSYLPLTIMPSTSQTQRFCVFFCKLLSSSPSKFDLLIKSKLVVFELRWLE